MPHLSLILGFRDFLSIYWDRHRERARALGELAHLAPGDLDALAAECGLSPGRLRQVTSQGRHAADELLKLADAVGVDVERLAAKNPRALNDMKLVCTECREKVACRKSLARRTIARDHTAFCDNAGPLADAKRELPFLSA